MQHRFNPYITWTVYCSSFHPLLPKEHNTLLKTPRKLNIRSVENSSEYNYHFVVKESSSKSQQLVNYLTSDLSHGISSILRQVNIDGLPLFHSACKQFGLFLGQYVVL